MMLRHSPLSLKFSPVLVAVAVTLSSAGCAHPPTRQQAAVPPAAPSSSTVAACDPTASYQPSARSTAVTAIAKRGFLVVGVSPLTRVGDRFQGFDAEMARVLARAIFPSAAANPDSRIRFKPITLEGRISELQTAVNAADINRGGVDVVINTFTPTCQARQSVTFSTPYFASGQRMVAGNGVSAQRISDLDQSTFEPQRNVRVCVAKNTPSYIALADKKKFPKFDLAAPDYILDCPAMLERDMVEVAASDAYLVTYFASQNPKVKVLKGSFGPVVPYSFAVSKRTPDLAAFTNFVLARVAQDGTWHKIYRGVFYGPLGALEPPKPNYALGRAPSTMPVSAAAPPGTGERSLPSRRSPALRRPAVNTTTESWLPDSSSSRSYGQRQAATTSTYHEFS